MGIDAIKEPFRKFICDNFTENCIWDMDGAQDYLPVQISKTYWRGPGLTTKNQYLKLCIKNENTKSFSKDFQLNKYPSLKGITFSYKDEYVSEFTNLTCPELSAGELEYWNQNLIFMQSFGIEILNQKQFEEKELDLSKNLSWRFRFVP